MVRYYKGEERAVLFDDHLAALAEREIAEKALLFMVDHLNEQTATLTARIKEMEQEMQRREDYIDGCLV